MSTGEMIAVTGKAGTVVATIEDMRRVEDLPRIEGQDVEQVRTILTDGSFTHIAALRHYHGDIEVTFVALKDQAGNWWDLNGQRLQLTEIPNGAPRQ